MGSKSNYAETFFIKYFFTTTSLTRPQNDTHVALGTDGSDTTFTEAVASAGNYVNYARIKVDQDGTTEPFWQKVGGGAIDSGSCENSSAVTFAAGSGTDNTVIDHFAIYDASTNGEYWFWGTTNSVTVTPGVTPSFATGAIDISED
jgi:hypothetical protein